MESEDSEEWSKTSTHTHAHTRTHNVPVPLFLWVTSACQLCLLHISPYALPSGDVFFPFVSSLGSPSPCLYISIYFCFIPQLPLFLYPRLLISCHLRVWTVNFLHSMLCSVSGECCLLLWAWQLPISSPFTWLCIALHVSLEEHVNCFWTLIIVH